MTVLILAFLFSMAMGDSVGIRMAKSLGEGRAQRAAFVARLGIIVSVVGGVVIAGAGPGGFLGAMDMVHWSIGPSGGSP